jgi:predicted SprT family Zn-dependent metalloprotease
MVLSDAIQEYKDKGISKATALTKAKALVSKSSGRWTAKKQKIFDLVWAGETTKLPKTKVSRSAKVPKNPKVVKDPKTPKVPKLKDPKTVIKVKIPKEPKVPKVTTKPVVTPKEIEVHGTEAILKKEYESMNPQTPINRATVFYLKMWHFFNTKHWSGHSLKVPTFRYLKDMGTGFGVRAHYRPSANQLSFSRRLFNADYNDFINVFQHEMCHQAVHQIDVPKGFQYRVNGKKRDVHGENWQAWMRHCKLSPRRCDMNDNTVYMDEKEKKAHIEKKEAVKKAQAERQPLGWGFLEDKVACFFNEKTKTWINGIVVCKHDNAGKRWVFADVYYGTHYWMIPPNNLFSIDPKDQEEMSKPHWLEHSRELRDMIQGNKQQKQQVKQLRKLARSRWGF